jgi:hypothetical protein
MNAYARLLAPGDPLTRSVFADLAARVRAPLACARAPPAARARAPPARAPPARGRTMLLANCENNVTLCCVYPLQI